MKWEAADVRTPWTAAKYASHAAYITELREHFPTPPVADVIRHNINWLIQSCYLPASDNESGSRARSDAPEGAINWGDLHCCDVEPLGEGLNARWLATIEEAAPDAHELQKYIEHWLGVWGWRVQVQTEW